VIGEKIGEQSPSPETVDRGGSVFSRCHIELPEKGLGLRGHIRIRDPAVQADLAHGSVRKLGQIMKQPLLPGRRAFLHIPRVKAKGRQHPGLLPC
jgi:hypothetical protein